MFNHLINRLPSGSLRDSLSHIATLSPGILISVVVALAAMFLSDHYGGPAMLFALLLGIAFNFLYSESACKLGIDFSARTVLRIGVALLGVRITFSDALALGPLPLVLSIAGVITTIGVGIGLAHFLGFDRKFGLLTGGAVGICGASAALAIASVLPKRDANSESDTIFTVILVTTLSTVAMVLYPILLEQLHFTDTQAGIFLGATIHDVAQVVGAGFSISPAAGEAATLTKLLRVAMLVPVVLAISVILVRGSGKGRVSLPGFLIGFVVLVILNSASLIPSSIAELLSEVSRWMLITAIAALGMKTMLGQIFAVGPKALFLVVIETVWIAMLGLVIVAML